MPPEVEYEEGAQPPSSFDPKDAEYNVSAPHLHKSSILRVPTRATLVPLRVCKSMHCIQQNVAVAGIPARLVAGARAARAAARARRLMHTRNPTQRMGVHERANNPCTCHAGDGEAAVQERSVERVQQADDQDEGAGGGACVDTR